MSPRVRWTLAGLTLAGCVAFALVRERGRSGPAPHAGPARVPPAVSHALRFNPESPDFGDLPMGQRRSLAVRVENVGPAKVRVERVEGSCGCLLGEMPVREIPPGEGRELTLTYTPLPGPRPDHYTLELYTDEPGGPAAMLPVRVRARAAITVEPETLSFGRLPKGVPGTLEAIVRRADRTSFTVEEVRLARPEFSVTRELLEGSEGAAWKIRVTARGARAGWIGDRAVVVTRRVDGSRGEAALFLTGEVLNDVTLTPSVALIRWGGERRVGPIEVVLARATAGPLAVVSVREAQNIPVEFTAEPLADGRLRLRLTLASPSPKQNPFGEIQIKTTAEEELLRLPYRLEKAPRSP